MSRNARLVLDVVLFVGVLFASSPSVTGMAAHEWLSLAIVVPLFVHCVVNWDWTVKAVRSFASTLRSASRLDLIVDAALFAATVAVMLSGLAVSRSIAGLFGTPVSADAVWHVVHAASAIALVALFAAHTALHARWIVAAARPLLAPRDAAPAPRERRAW